MIYRFEEDEGVAKMAKMVATGIIRRVDMLGGIMIPRDIRRRMRIEEGDTFEYLIAGDDLVLRRYRFGTDGGRNGEWQNDTGYDDWYCSKCGFEINYDGEYPAEYDNFKYCGRCGANMKKEGENK